jgi:hypothetical protein
VRDTRYRDYWIWICTHSYKKNYYRAIVNDLLPVVLIYGYLTLHGLHVAVLIVLPYLHVSVDGWAYGAVKSADSSHS